jgi:signal transduction histidine kinase
MARVFINLFKNALQAIPQTRPADIHIDVLKLNRIVWIRIKDNGTGIPETMQEKIFQPDFTTKSGGMGIGLAMVRNIIESAGGTISFRTKQDEGTTFIISLPAIET